MVYVYQLNWSFCQVATVILPEISTKVHAGLTVNEVPLLPFNQPVLVKLTSIKPDTLSIDFTLEMQEFTARGPSKVFLVGGIPYVFIILKSKIFKKAQRVFGIKFPPKKIPVGTRLFTFTQNSGVADGSEPRTQKVFFYMGELSRR